MNCLFKPMLSVLGLIVCFTTVESSYGAQMDDQLPLPSVTVSRTDQPPTIDGQIKDGEWQTASTVGGFVTLGRPDLAKQRTEVFVTYDDQKLYIAYRNHIAGGRPNATKMKRDGSVWGGDSIELSIVPPWMKQGRYYHFIGNYQDSIYDAVKTKAGESGQLDASWNGNWKFRNYVWEGVWNAEISIPLKDLKVKNPQGKWRMNFARTEQAYTSWAYTGRGYHNPDAFGRVRLVGKAPAVRIDSVRGLGRGQMKIAGSVFNPTEKPAKVKLNATLKPLELALGSDDAVLNQAVRQMDKTLDVAPGKREPFELEESFGNRILDLLTLNISANHQTLLESNIPFSLKQRRAVSFVPLASEDTLKVRLDMRRLETDKPVRITGRFMNDSQKSLKTFSFKDIPPKKQTIKTLEIKDLSPGKYQVQVKVSRSGGGQVLKEEKTAYTRKPTPKWYKVGQTLGTDQRVLKPWTPIQRTEDGIRLWGRRLTFGQSPLFSQIHSQDKPLLRRPITITATINGKRQRFAFHDRTFDGQKDTAMDWTTRGRLGPVGVRLECHLEYDGMVRIHMTLNPSSALKITNLQLHMPMTKAASAYYHASSSYYNSGDSGYVPDDGLNLAFQPYLWLGNLHRGLMWFAQAPRNWHVQGKPLSISKGPARDMTITFMDQPTDLDDKLPITFGLMPTPVKKMPDGWRGINLGGRYDQNKRWKNIDFDWALRRLDGGTPNDRYWTNDQGKRLRVGHSTPLKANTPYLKKQVDQDHAQGVRSMIYEYLSGATAGRTTDFARYKSTWQRLPVKQLDYGVIGLIHGACYGSSFADFMLYGRKYLYDQTGADGDYWDGGGGVPLCANPLHGHGWTNPYTGRFRGQYPIFDQRRFTKRLATMYEDLRGPGNYVIWNHVSQTVPLPFLSFSTAYLDGESPFQRVREGGPTLPKLVSLDYLRVMASGEPWGIIPTWLVYPRVGHPEVLEATLAIILPHGTPPFALGWVTQDNPNATLMGEVWKAQQSFGIGQAHFVGYWENGDYLRLRPNKKRVICSLYQREDRTMLILSNLTTKPVQASVKLHPEKFNHLSQPQAHDAITGEKIPLENQTITTQLGSEKFKMIVLK